VISFLTTEPAAGSSWRHLALGGSQDLLKRAWAALRDSDAIMQLQRNAHSTARANPDAVAAVGIVVQAMRARLLLLDDDEFFAEQRGLSLKAAAEAVV